MLINLTNHPSSSWEPVQIRAAHELYGEIRDQPFPPVPPEADYEEIARLAVSLADKCSGMLAGSDRSRGAVHVMGESTLCFALVTLLRERRIRCIASTTVRESQVNGSEKVSRFTFCRFRDYFYLNDPIKNE